MTNLTNKQNLSNAIESSVKQINDLADSKLDLDFIRDELPAVLERMKDKENRDFGERLRDIMLVCKAIYPVLIKEQAGKMQKVGQFVDTRQKALEKANQ